MRPRLIEQFLFPYQHSLRISVEVRAKNVFERIGADAEPHVFLVGIAWPAIPGRHDICIEPEEGPWPQSLFSTTPESLEVAWRQHPDQRMFYGDEQTMRDKPENICRSVVTEAVKRDLDRAYVAHGVRSFVSRARPIDGYYVVTVVQAPEALFAKFPPISYEWMGEPAESSFLLSCIQALLREAERALELPQPGRFIDDGFRSAEEIARQAASNFMRTPFLSGEMAYSDIFSEFNAISRLMYEGTKGRGRMILAKADDPKLDYVMKLAEPVQLRDTRWARKLLQMGSGDMALITGYQSIYGFGRIAEDDTPSCSVEFFDQQQWDFRHGNRILLRTQFGEPRLPQELISDSRFLDNFKRIFLSAGDEAAARYRGVLKVLLEQSRGCMLVVAEDAAIEAERLDLQGTRIEPTPLTPDLIDRASRIDGTILADPQGVCHAIGVILDGAANDRCTPSRGARYNSAIRYVDTSTAKRLAFVISEDGTLDIVPLLRPRVSVAEIETMITTLENATLDSHYAPRNYLVDRRFYLNEDQCTRVNSALDRFDALSLEDGRIRLIIDRFQPDPAMNDNYLAP
ncbi:diadenylate cyclase [Sphingobium sp. HBC34]|uniref:Diadenylate cyclase n=1 Tax=Sphingobium cyanobacteriorum TaxID=3063954 RepID=A0ABT8ZSR2_9SPHN|nr:diadenylate cyclase [Sphingobium sp. HBC34]MDO7837570.1 diadenylate cyclase [Sphingobium sp. HBC34]